MKFKVGDTVYLLPYEDFEHHIGIPKDSWDATNSHVVTSVYGVHHEAIDSIYYYWLDNGYYAYSEDFLHVEKR